MDSGFYAALTGLVAKSDALDLAANNFANVGTTGYKAQEEFYHALQAAGSGPLSPLTQAADNYGVLGGASLDLRPGSMQTTGNDLDVALQGSGFLVAKTAAGYRYTRNGSLHLDANSELLTAEGDPVMGLVPGKKDPGPIHVPPGKITIGPDGTISVDGAVSGQLQIVDFPHGTLLKFEGNSYMDAPSKEATPAKDPQLRQGSVESSNVNPMLSMVNLVTLQRETEMMQHALSTFDRSFNQPAINTLATA
jgi:flagellar basal-body rod protein FlgF